MNPLNERYSDLVGDQNDQALLDCIADLDATCSAFTLPAGRDASLAARLRAPAREVPQGIEPSRPWMGITRRLPWRAARWRLTSLTLAVLIAIGAGGTYLRGSTPTPVSAQTVLHRAAAVSPGPNEATHATYRLSAGGGYTGTGEVWIGANESGAPSEFALTVSMARDGVPAPDLSSRLVLEDRTFQVYDPARNTVTISSPRAADQELEGMFVGTLVAQKLTRALAANVQPAFELQQRTLDGVAVYALTLNRAEGGQTFYFNTQSYILEGADWVQSGRSWQARLDPASYQTMALSAAPPSTFTLNAPPTAHVITLAPPESTPKSSVPDRILSALAAACNTTPGAIMPAVQAGNKSMLAICQETAPGMTVDRLVAALMAPFKAELDANVAAGAVTPAQEADDLARLQMKLTHLVTDRPGAAPGAKKP